MLFRLSCIGAEMLRSYRWDSLGWMEISESASFMSNARGANNDILACLTDEVAVPALEDSCRGTHLLKAHLCHQIARM